MSIRRLTTVYDANGDVVGNYNGTATLSFATSGKNGAVALYNSTTGQYDSSLTSVQAPIVNGVATFKVESLTTPGVTDSLYISEVQNGSLQPLTGVNGANVQSAPLSISTVAQVATSLSFKPSSTTIEANDTLGTDPVYVEVNDQAGNPMLSGQWAINVSVSGVGHISGSANNQTTVVYNGLAAGVGQTNKSASFTVTSIQGQTGTITLYATSTGLQSATGTITAVIAGTPAGIKISPVTTSFTAGAAINNGAEFTIQEVDANGNPIVGQGDATLNVTFVKGTTPASWLTVEEANAAGQPSGATIPVNSSGVASISLTNGSATLFVTDNSNGDAGSYTATVSSPVGAQYSLASASITFTETAGPIAQVAVTSPTPPAPGIPIVVQQATPSTTYTLQLEDAKGNAVAQSGVTVDVWAFEVSPGASGNPATSSQMATVNGVSMAGNSTASNALALTTNAQGQITVTLVPQSYQGATWELQYSVPAQVGINAIAQQNSPEIQLEPALTSKLVVSLKDTSAGADLNSPSYAIAGNTVAATITSEDQYGNTFSSSDVVQLTIPAGLSGGSQPSGVSMANGSTWTTGASNTVDVTLVNGTATVNLEAWTAGSATLQASDLTAPSASAGTASITVQPGSATGAAFFQNGKEVTSTNEVAVTADTPVAVQLEPVDVAGNPVLSATPITVTLTDNGGGGTFETSPTGGATTSATIPAGTSSITLYYVNATSGSYNLSAVPAVASLTLTKPSGTITAGTPSTWTLTANNSSGGTDTALNGTFPIVVNGAVNSPNGTAPTVPTTATFTSGVATLSITLTSATTQNISVSALGASSSPVSVAPVAAAPANISVGAVNSAAETAGGVFSATVTLTDQFGNPVSGSQTIQVYGTVFTKSPNGATAQYASAASGSPLTLTSPTAFSGTTYTEPTTSSVNTISLTFGSNGQATLYFEPVAATSGSTTDTLGVALPSTTATSPPIAAATSPSSITVSAAAPTYTEVAAASSGTTLATTVTSGATYPVTAIAETAGTPSQNTAYAYVVNLYDAYGNTAVAPTSGTSVTLTITANSSRTTLPKLTVGTTSTSAVNASGDSVTLTIASGSSSGSFTYTSGSALTTAAADTFTAAIGTGPVTTVTTGNY